MGKIRGEIGGEITGTVGDVTIVIWKGLRIVKRKCGPRTKPPSQAELEQRTRFRAASDYAREAGLDGGLKALYANLARDLPTNWRALAIKDYLAAPQIVQVQLDDYHGRKGGTIGIRLRDVTVKEVEVRLLALKKAQSSEDSADVLVECGQAVRAREGADSFWVYTTQKSLPGKSFRLVITAEDVPGNRVTHTLEGEV